jgi:ATP-binding cassette subfamily B protein
MSEKVDLDADLREIERPIFRLLLEYGSKRKLLFFIGIFGGITGYLVNIVPPTRFGTAIDTVFGTKPLQLPLLSGMMPESQLGQFHILVSLIVAAFMVEAVLNYLRGYGLNAFAQHVQHDVRVDTYDAMQKLEMDFFHDNSSGELMSVLNNDVNRLEQFLNTELNQIVRVVMVTGTIGVVLFWVYPSMAVVALIPVPIIALASGGFLVWIDRQYRAIRAIVGRLNSRLANNLGGMPVIKSFVRESYEEDRVADEGQEWHKRHIHALLVRQGFLSLLRQATCVVFVVNQFFGGLDVINGAVSVSVFTMSDIDERGISAVVDDALEVASAGVDGIHVSLDLDWLDPDEAPGVGTPVRGGVTYREAHSALEAVAAAEASDGLLRSFEVVEVNPILDTHNRTAELAVELAASALGKRIL